MYKEIHQLKGVDMGLIYAEVELINCSDRELARRYIIGEEEIKRMNVTMLVDTGCYMLTINENIQEVLQFSVVEKKRMRLANEEIVECDIVGPVELRFKNRQTICRAIVLPGDSEPLLGAIPLEEMDVVIDLQRQELIVHPDRPDMAQVRV